MHYPAQHRQEGRGISNYLKLGYLRYLSTVGILTTEHGCQHAPILQKHAGIPTLKLSNSLTASIVGGVSSNMHFGHVKQSIS